MENEDFSAKFPPPKLPATEDIRHIEIHAVDKKEIPTLEALAEDGHFTETTTRAATGEEHCCRGFGFDEDLRAHRDSGSKLTGYVAKEPIFRHTETGVLVERLHEKLAIPKSDGTVGECGRADLSSKLTLDTAELVLEILRLLTVVADRAVGTHTLDGVTETFDVALQAVRDNWKVRWQCAVVVNQQDVLEGLRCVAANELGHNLRSDRRPEVVDTVWAADLFGVVERSWAVTVCEHVNVRWRKDFQCCFKRRANEVG